MAENRVEANAHNAGGCPASNAIHGHINDFLVRTGLRSGVSELQLPCFTAVRAEIALMSGSAFAVTHHAFSSGAGRTADRNRSHWSTSKTPSYTKSVSWQHHQQSESSLPDLASETAQQEEQSNKGKSFKERGANYVTESAQQGFENLTPEALESQARSYLQGQITSSAQSYIEGALSPYGKVRSNLSIGQGGDLDGSSIDYFVPWYDNQSTVYFSQFSAQRKEERTIGNIGLGVRHNFDKWLLGGNIFYDYDFTRGHRRLGLGTEAWTDYLKFSGNYYHPLSEWKDSKDFDFYLERPARGWDVRAEAWLPSYPQLGSKIVFEQYYGDEVALIGTDNLEKDPYAVTLGVNYQPVPLLTVGTDYKAGTGDNSDLSVNATINYQFGVPLKDQLNSDNVKAAHSLMGSRHDFVERNNFIVLEYKEKDPLDVTLWLKADATNEHPDCVIKDTPEAAVGLEKCKWTINALINHHYKIVVAS